MRHARLWQPSDWAFALDSLELSCWFYETGSGAAEQRIRERVLGTTLDARWNLRIKYVEARSTAGRGHHGQQTRTTGGCDRDGRPSLPSLGSA
jgi:hypothetical protein